MKTRIFEECDILAELSANEQWAVDQETGEVDYSNLLADGGGGEFSNYLCETHGDACDTWDDVIQHKIKAKEDWEKATKIRTNMPGYLWGETLMPYLTDNEVLRATELKDQLAAIHNSAADRKKRKYEVA